MSRAKRLAWGFGLGLVLAIPLMAVLYLPAQIWGMPFLPFSVFEWITQRLPGPLITRSIDLMVAIIRAFNLGPTDQTAKAAETALGVALSLGLVGVLGAVFALLDRALPGKDQAERAMAFAFLPWAVSVLLVAGGNEISVLLVAALLLILWLAWGRILGLAMAWITEPRPETTAPGAEAVSRRDFVLRLGGGALLLSLGAVVLAQLFKQRGSDLAGQPLPSEAAPAPTPAANGFVPAPGTRPELTPNDNFYRVDINLGSPAIDSTTWRLSVSGLVEHTLSLTYVQIVKMPSVDQFATLECISNPVGGDLISTTRWTGVPLKHVLDMAGLKPGVVELKFTSVDGYTESLPLESALDERTLLVYAMNGERLPQEHGFPVRIYTPNRFGMKNPKWLQTIEAIGADYTGYWEERGWNKQAIIKTTSVVDTSGRAGSANGKASIGGIAFAGARSIQRVEVRIDNGPWQPATLKTPLSPLTWVLWRYDFTATPGFHQATVRAVDGTGAPQSEENSDVEPDGASGYQTVTIEV